MKSRRVAAATALGLGAAALVLVVATAARGFPRGLVVAGLLFLAFVAAWEAIRRRNRARMACAAVAVLLLAATFVVLLRGRVWAELILAGVLFALATVAARSAFRLHVALPVAIPPSRPVVVWNPRSGGGKAKAAHVDDEARARGIEPIELRPGDDLPALVRDAVARGADALAAAGGDGTQALVAGNRRRARPPVRVHPGGHPQPLRSRSRSRSHRRRRCPRCVRRGWRTSRRPGRGQRPGVREQRVARPLRGGGPTPRLPRRQTARDARHRARVRRHVTVRRQRVALHRSARRTGWPGDRHPGVQQQLPPGHDARIGGRGPASTTVCSGSPCSPHAPAGDHTASRGTSGRRLRSRSRPTGPFRPVSTARR